MLWTGYAPTRLNAFRIASPGWRTLQKFPFISQAIRTLEKKGEGLSLTTAGKRFAVIVDEAHIYLNRARRWRHSKASLIRTALQMPSPRS